MSAPDLSPTNADRLHELWERSRITRQEMEEHLRIMFDGAVCVPASAHTRTAGGNCSCAWFEERRLVLVSVENEVRTMYRTLGLGRFPRTVQSAKGSDSCTR